MRIYYDLFRKVDIGYTQTHPHAILDINNESDLNPKQFLLKARLFIAFIKLFIRYSVQNTPFEKENTNRKETYNA